MFISFYELEEILVPTKQSPADQSGNMLGARSSLLSMKSDHQIHYFYIL